MQNPNALGSKITLHQYQDRPILFLQLPLATNLRETLNLLDQTQLPRYTRYLYKSKSNYIFLLICQKTNKNNTKIQKFPKNFNQWTIQSSINDIQVIQCTQQIYKAYYEKCKFKYHQFDQIVLIVLPEHSDEIMQKINNQFFNSAKHQRQRIYTCSKQKIDIWKIASNIQYYFISKYLKRIKLEQKIDSISHIVSKQLLIELESKQSAISKCQLLAEKYKNCKCRQYHAQTPKYYIFTFTTIENVISAYIDLVEWIIADKHKQQYVIGYKSIFFYQKTFGYIAVKKGYENLIQQFNDRYKIFIFCLVSQTNNLFKYDFFRHPRILLHDFKQQDKIQVFAISKEFTINCQIEDLQEILAECNISQGQIKYTQENSNIRVKTMTEIQSERIFINVFQKNKDYRIFFK